MADGPPRPHARHAPYDGMGGVVRCYRTPPGQPAIGGSTSTHGLLLNRPGARGGAILVCTGRPRKACKHRMQHGMKCVSCVHARDVTWEVGWRGVIYIHKTCPRSAVSHPIPDIGPGRASQEPLFCGVRKHAVARRDERIWTCHAAWT